jgi:hypothetical protein
MKRRKGHAKTRGVITRLGMTTTEVAHGLGVRPDAVRRVLRRYGAVREGHEWELPPNYVWACIYWLRIGKNGLWFGQSFDQLEELIGPYPPWPLDDLFKEPDELH